MKILIAILLITFMLPLKADNKNMAGNWLMYLAESPSRKVEPYFVMQLAEDGDIKIFEMTFGTWQYNANKNKLELVSDKDKDFNGIFDIELFKKDTLIIRKDSVKFSLAKLDYKKISENNKLSGLQGLWKSTTQKNAYIKFSLPYYFLKFSKSGGALNRYRGEWFYDKRDSTIVIISFVRELKGRTKVVEKNDTSLTLLNKNNRFEFLKTDVSKFKIEKLKFDYKDLEDIEDETDKLPWNDYDIMLNYLAGVKSLVFTRGYLIKDINVFLYDTLLSLVKVDINKNKINFINKVIMNNDTMQTSENYRDELQNRYNRFFPQSDPVYFRVTGIDTVRVPAGRFVCTVVEAIDGDNKLKFWMINDKPGIYAKIITVRNNDSEESDYYINELIKIENK